MSILLLSRDLLVNSQLSGVAGRYQLAMEVTSDATAAVARCRTHRYRLLLIDLSLPDLEVATLVAAVRDVCDEPPRIVAFGPHVHTARLEAAREAECDDVLSRGELHTRLAPIVAAAARQ